MPGLAGSAGIVAGVVVEVVVVAVAVVIVIVARVVEAVVVAVVVVVVIVVVGGRHLQFKGSRCLWMGAQRFTTAAPQPFGTKHQLFPSHSSLVQAAFWAGWRCTSAFRRALRGRKNINILPSF